MSTGDPIRDTARAFGRVTEAAFGRLFEVEVRAETARCPGCGRESGRAGALCADCEAVVFAAPEIEIIDCGECGGKGRRACAYEDPDTGATCYGTGEIALAWMEATQTDPQCEQESAECPACDGAGEVECAACGGKGKVEA